MQIFAINSIKDGLINEIPGIVWKLVEKKN